ncbi:type IV secretory system conjugative DNA transfer family protein (plasmid) [Mycoplasmatota bacterium]|nr:type IV secretory system conjugative DNA transfer family protein [Mycoplasmatota bacterium]
MKKKRFKHFVILYGILLFIQLLILPYLIELVGSILGRNPEPSFYLFGWFRMIGNQLFLTLAGVGNLWLIIGIVYFVYRDGVSFNLDSSENERPKSSGTSEYGSAREQTPREMKVNYSEYEVGEDLSTKVYPKNKSKPMSSNGGMILHSELKRGKVKTFIDRDDVHTIVIGTTGSGKTRRLVIPSIEVLANARESMILTDPKGELYSIMGGFLKEKGFEVILLDFRDTNRGNQWNILELVNEYMDNVNKYTYQKSAIDFINNLLNKYSKENKPVLEILKIAEEFANNQIEELQDIIYSSETTKTKDWKNYNTAFQTLEITSIINNIEYNEEKNMFLLQEKMIESYNKLISSYKLEAQSDDFKKKYYENKIKLIEAYIKEVENLKIVEGKPLLTVSIVQTYFSTLLIELQSNIDLYEAKAFETANDIAHVLVFGKQTDRMTERIWLDGQKSLIASLILFVSRESTSQNARHMGSVYTILATKGITVRGTFGSDITYLDKLMDELPDNDICKKALAPLRVAGDKMKTSFLGSATTTLSLFADPNIVEMTSKSSIKLDTISTKPTAVFLVIPDERDTRDFLPILFIDQAYTKFVDIANKQPSQRLPIRVNCLLDEFGNMPSFNSFTKKLTVSRSRRIRWFMIIQDFRQLEASYKEDEKTIKSNCQWIYLLTSDSKTAEDISKRCGTYTTLVESRSKSASEINKLSHSASLQVQKRELYLPDELIKFQIGEALILTQRLNPAKTKLIDISEYPYFDKVIETQDLNEYEPRPRITTKYFNPDPTEFSSVITSFNSGLLFYDLFVQKVIMNKEANNSPLNEVETNEYSDEELERQTSEARAYSKKRRRKRDNTQSKDEPSKKSIKTDEDGVVIDDVDEDIKNVELKTKKENEDSSEDNNDNDNPFDGESIEDILTDTAQIGECLDDNNDEIDLENLNDENNNPIEKKQKIVTGSKNSTSSTSDQIHKNNEDIKAKVHTKEYKLERKDEFDIKDEDFQKNLKEINLTNKIVNKKIPSEDIQTKISYVEGILKDNSKDE